MSEPTESQVNAQRALDALPALDSEYLLTADERACMKILREACLDIIRGGDLSPAPAGQHKLRLLRRISVGYFEASAPRAKPIEPLGPVPGGAA